MTPRKKLVRTQQRTHVQVQCYLLPCVSFLATLRRQRRRPRFRCATPPARLRRPGPTPAPPSSAASAHRRVTMAGASWTGLQRGWAGYRSLTPQIPRAR
jgi:hypothetical protein